VLEQKGLEAQKRVLTSQASFDGEGTWTLLKDADRIEIAKGKKLLIFDPKTDDPQVILDAAIGRSGNLRAPAMREGAVWYIGFHPDFF